MSRATRWRYRMVFVLLVAMILYVRIIPVAPGPGALPWPDLLLTLILAWIQRRPDHLPALLIAGALLAQDIALMRPLGLGAGLGFAAAEFLRGHNRGAGERPFAGEWVFVAVLIAGLTLIEMVVMLILEPGLAQPGSHLARALMSVIAYPVVALAIGLLGVRRPAPAERDGALEDA